MNGNSKTIFALANQKSEEAMNKAKMSVNRDKGHNGVPSNSTAVRSPRPLLDKYKVNRTETGIHEKPWDNSELPPERREKELRLLPIL